MKYGSIKDTHYLVFHFLSLLKQRVSKGQGIILVEYIEAGTSSIVSGFANLMCTVTITFFL